MPWTDKDDTNLLLVLLDLNVTISRDTFASAGAKLGYSRDLCR